MNIGSGASGSHSTTWPQSSAERHSKETGGGRIASSSSTRRSRGVHSMVFMDTMVITVEEAGRDMMTSSTVKLVCKQPLVLA